MAVTIKTFAEKLAANARLTKPQADSIAALAARLVSADALEARRLRRAFMDDAALADLGIEDAAVAAVARQLVTAREMEVGGEPLEEVAGEAYGWARAEIARLTEAGDAEGAARLQAGLDAALADDDAATDG